MFSVTASPWAPLAVLALQPTPLISATNTLWCGSQHLAHLLYPPPVPASRRMNCLRMAGCLCTLHTHTPVLLSTAWHRVVVAGSAQLSGAKWLTKRLPHCLLQFKFQMKTNKQAPPLRTESSADTDTEQQASKPNQAVFPQSWRRPCLSLQAEFPASLARVSLSK